MGVAEGEAELPMACEACLGASPYVAMQREVGGAACTRCGRPVTVFTWNCGPKGTGARPARTRVCRACAGAAAVCQCCLKDLRYGLPVAVRDALVAAAFERVGAKRTRDVAEIVAGGGGDHAGGMETAAVEAAHADLARHAASTNSRGPRRRTHQRRACSFFAKGKCARGAACPFRHEAAPQPAPHRGLGRGRGRGSSHYGEE